MISRIGDYGTKPMCFNLIKCDFLLLIEYRCFALLLIKYRFGEHVSATNERTNAHQVGMRPGRLRTPGGARRSIGAFPGA